MADNALPESVGEKPLSPIVLLPEDEELCARLDDLLVFSGHRVKPSNLFKGALFATRIECRNNADWMPQAAHSLREILYPFWKKQRDKVFKKYGSVHAGDKLVEKISRVYGLLNNLAHHGSTSSKFNLESFNVADFDKLLSDFTDVMRDALTRQVDVHGEIDEIVAFGPPQRVKKHKS